MELTELKDKILQNFNGTHEELETVLADERIFFPFNEFELLITTLVSKNELTYNKYLEIRDEYYSQNPNLWIFEISAPRGFGESFAQTFLRNKSLSLKAPSKLLDPNYKGQYDLWLDGIKIEVKASRVTDAEKVNEPLYRKALSSKTKRPFLMNFQQLKPQCCDVFIWMAVYRDCITIWVMSSSEVLSHPDYSKGQHRGNHGNEGQLHITQDNIKTLSKYKLKSDNLVGAIKKAYKRNNY